MQKLELIEKYQCDGCSTWYSEEDDGNTEWPRDAMDAEEAAQLCCAPSIAKAYFCPVCDKRFRAYFDAKEHLKTPHSSPDSQPNEKYYELLFEGVPPIDAWQKSHRIISDDRRIIEEVLQI